MSSIDDDLQGVEGGPTWEEALHKLLKMEGLELHTEIANPDPMTIIDVVGDRWADTIAPSLGKLIKGSQKWRRKNYVAYKRKRALEIISGIKGQVEDEKRKKDMQEVMMGVRR